MWTGQHTCEEREGKVGGIAKVSSVGLVGAPCTDSEPYQTKFFYQAKTRFF